MDWPNLRIYETALWNWLVSKLILKSNVIKWKFTWNYPAGVDSVASRLNESLNEDHSTRPGIRPYEFLVRRSPDVSKTTQAAILLLVTLWGKPCYWRHHIFRLRKQSQNSRKRHPCWPSFPVQGSAMLASGNKQTNRVGLTQCRTCSCSNDMPGKVCAGETVIQVSQSSTFEVILGQIHRRKLCSWFWQFLEEEESHFFKDVTIGKILMIQWTAPHPRTYGYTETVLTRFGDIKIKGVKLRGRWAEDMGRVGWRLGE